MFEYADGINDSQFPISFEIAQSPDDAHTDVIFSAEAPATSSETSSTTISAKIRHSGTISLNPSGVVLVDL